LSVHKPAGIGTGELHLIIDSAGLKLRGAGEGLFEKHETTKRRAWRKLHTGIDAGGGEIVAFDLTDELAEDLRLQHALEGRRR
jgi:Transposase DDE domain